MTPRRPGIVRPATSAVRRVVLDEPALIHAVADWVTGAAQRAIAVRGRCTMALAGGKTPQRVYEALATAPYAHAIDWAHINVYFSDERAVAPDHPDSNYRMVYEALLGRVPIPAAQIHRMEAEAPDLDAAAVAYERLLPRRLDLLLLGMGADGHTASLFPGSGALAEWRRSVVAVHGPKPPAERLTITPRVIAAARNLGVMVTGDDKAKMVVQALEGPDAPGDLPAQLARRGVWFLDHRAAALLALGTAMA